MAAKAIKKALSPEQCEYLIKTLKARFEKNINRHIGLKWNDVFARLEHKNSVDK